MISLYKFNIAMQTLFPKQHVRVVPWPLWIYKASWIIDALLKDCKSGIVAYVYAVMLILLCYFLMVNLILENLSILLLRIIKYYKLPPLQQLMLLVYVKYITKLSSKEVFDAEDE